MEFKLRQFYQAGYRFILLAILLIFAGFAVDVSGQDGNLFDTRTVERTIKHQYGLTTQELNTLRPILRRQNAELVIVLNRCMDEEQTDYFSLWTRLWTKREEFESVSVKGMTRRQTQVLRTARLKFELRILTQWRSFYVEGLGSFLELDWFQATVLDKIFQKDQQERMKIILAVPTSREHLERSWQRLSEEIERQLKPILSPDQLRDYRKLNAKSERLVA